MFALASSPQSIGKTLDCGIKLFFSGLKKVFFLALIAALVAKLPWILLSPEVPTAQEPGGANPLQGLGVELILFLTAAGLVTVALHSAILRRLAQRVGGGQAADDTLGGSLTVGFKYLVPVLLGFILYALAVGTGAILLIVPGVFLAVSLYLFWPAIVLEGKGPVEALKRSHRLVRGNWWRTLTVVSFPVFLIVIFYMAAMFAIGVFFGATSAGDGQALANSIAKTTMLLQLTEVPVNAVSSALFYSMLVVLYHDLKLRKEGGDLEARLARA